MAAEVYLNNDKGDIYTLNSNYLVSYYGKTSLSLTDLEVDRSGTIFGLTLTGLYVFGLPDAAGSLAAQSVTVSLPASANAMAMDLDGDMWIAGGGRITEYSVTKSGSSYVLNQKSQISHNYSSSGDILIRDGFLYLTAKQDQAGDLLLTFDLLDRSLYNVQFLENTPKAYGLFF